MPAITAHILTMTSSDPCMKELVPFVEFTAGRICKLSILQLELGDGGMTKTLGPK